MHLCLFEDDQIFHFSPLTLTRGVYELRTGAKTNIVRLWELFGKPDLSLHARANIADLIRLQTGLQVNELPEDQGVLLLNGRITAMPADIVVHIEKSLTETNTGRVFLQDSDIVAAWVPAGQHLASTDTINRASFASFHEEQLEGIQFISRLWHLIDYLEPMLRSDLADLMLKPQDRKGEIHASALLVNPAAIYIAPGAIISPGAILNATDGPIYIAEDALVMEAAVVRGPVYMGKKSVVKTRSEISKSVLGPVCKAGGEVNTVIFHSYSNKAHEGFLGHSYLGSWCNIGAGTNVSNLRNDYGEITLYNEALGVNEKSGRQFLGAIVADHSKIGISSMVNTGTIIGTNCNLFGEGFLPRYLPSCSWGSPAGGFTPYRLDKAFHSIERVMARRGKIPSQEMMDNLKHIFYKTHENKLSMAT